MCNPLWKCILECRKILNLPVEVRSLVTGLCFREPYERGLRIKSPDLTSRSDRFIMENWMLWCWSLSKWEMELKPSRCF